MLILGVDPGYARVGWCVLESSTKDILPKILGYGCIETSLKEEGYLRILRMADAFQEVLLKYSPDVLAVEELFFLKKSRSLFQIAQSRGALIYLAVKSGMKIFEYNPKVVKKSIVGCGSASKEQIQGILKTILGLKEIPQPDDAADAIAIALCHYFSHERFKTDL